jgi:hypothetical protein
MVQKCFPSLYLQSGSARGSTGFQMERGSQPGMEFCKREGYVRFVHHLEHVRENAPHNVRQATGKRSRDDRRDSVTPFNPSVKIKSVQGFHQHANNLEHPQDNKMRDSRRCQRQPTWWCRRAAGKKSKSQGHDQPKSAGRVTLSKKTTQARVIARNP